MSDAEDPDYDPTAEGEEVQVGADGEEVDDDDNEDEGDDVTVVLDDENEKDDELSLIHI